MGSQPDDREVAVWQRYFAAHCNNRAWELMSRPGRTDEETREMVDVAHAAAWHWSKVGEAVNYMRADVTLAMAYAWAELGETALRYARRALAFAVSEPCEDWDVAFAHLAMAFAAAEARDAELAALHGGLARDTGAAIVEEDDREVYLAEMERVEAYLEARAR